MGSNGEWTVVLTPEGEFMKIPSHPHHLEGMEVSFRVSATVATPKKKKAWNPPVIRGVAFAAACLLLLVMVFPFFGGSQAYAAVTFDINPSLELEVDEHAKVIEATAFNEEAQKLLDTVEWKGLSLSEVALDIIEQAEQMGYMNAERQVLITTTYLGEEKEEEEEEEDITLILEEATSQADQELTVVIVEGNKKWHNEAKKKNVPPGAYMLVKQAEEQGIELNEKEWQANRIEELPPVKGVTVIHPKGSKSVKEKHQDKEKGEKRQKPESKKDDKHKTEDIEKKALKKIKENQKDKQQDRNKDMDDNKAEQEREEEHSNQKHSKNEKGPLGPPSHDKKDSSKHEIDDDLNEKKDREKDDRDEDDGHSEDHERNKKERD